MTYLNQEAVNWAFDRVVAISNDKLVLLTIARCVNKQWAAFPGKAEIARITGLAEETIAKSVRRLEREGHLIRIAFAATSGQDQKVGYVLAGCGKPLNALDADFLALAFANRKQPGVPLAAKPQHWSGEQKGEGGASATLPGRRRSHPEGGAGATPRSKEHTEDQKEQEEAFGEAGDKSPAPQDQAAVAEAHAAASATDIPVSPESKIPTQRQRRDRRSPIQRRDDDWTAQITAANIYSLKDAIEDYEMSQGGLWTWAQSAAGLDAGLLPNEEWERDEDQEDHFRAAYLWLLKKHADDDWLSRLVGPLDDQIEAPVPAYEWIEHCPAPAGLSREEFAKRMADAVRNTPPAELGPVGAEIRRIRPGVWSDCRKEAKRRLKDAKRTADLVSINGTAILAAIDHYLKLGSDWPAAVVPPSLRTAFPAQSEPPAWAA